MQKPTTQADLDLVRQLRTDVRGPVIAPGDPQYDAARTIYYSGYDRRPAAIVKVADAADVARVVAVGRDADVPLAVRSGGHSIAGHGIADGGITLDLSAMRRLEIEPVGQTAWAETGLTAGEYTSAVGAHGLATGFGDTASVGIGGITLGGGIGFLHRKYGLTIDSLLAAEVVTADGELVRTDAEAHPDLFWAIRGGGGNFGVATRFRYRLHEVGDVMGGMLLVPATADLIVRFMAGLVEAPEELSGMVNVMAAPPMPLVPAELHGKPILFANLVHSGPIEAGEREFDRLRSLATPVVDMVRATPYGEIYEAGEPPQPARVAIRSVILDEVDGATAEAILDSIREPGGTMRVTQLRVMGGAVARVPREATAFGHRDRQLLGTVASMYERPAEAAQHEAWVEGLAGTLRQGEPGAYVGFMGDGQESRVREAYPGGTWDRLAAIKARYDPGNVFRLNQNVPPAEGRARDGA